MKTNAVKVELDQERSQVSPIGKIASIAEAIANLDTRLAAELRRGPLVGAGSVAYWRFLAKYDIPPSSEKRWADVFQSVAVLTPKGKPRAGKQSAHDSQCSMGRALHAAKISEMRLARFLALSPEMRGSHAVRLCRRLSAAGHNRFDLKTLTAFILGWKFASQKIAREYYRAAANAPTPSQPKT